MFVESSYDHHYDWCQEITKKLNLQLIPKIMHTNFDYHEVIVFISPIDEYFEYDDLCSVKTILKSRDEISLPRFHKIHDNQLIMSHFLVKHYRRNTVTGSLNSIFHDEHSQIESRVIAAKKGVEKWLFRGNKNILNQIKDKINSETLGVVSMQPRDSLDDRAITAYAEFFKMLGANRSSANLLGAAKYYELFKNIHKEEIQDKVSKKCEYKSRKQLLDNLSRSIVMCSWIHNTLNNFKHQQ